MRTVFINGKFVAQPTTGVQRVASNLVSAIDCHLAQFDSTVATRWVLLCPPVGVTPSLRRIEVRTLGPRWMGTTAWEQVLLPLACRGSLLVSLSGSAPAFKREQVCMIHDAAVFEAPAAYRFAFAAWYRFLFRRLATTAALILTVSEYSRQRLVHWLQPTSAVAVVRNGAEHLNDCVADESMLARLQVRSGGYLLAVGSAAPHKNQRAIVEAFASSEVQSHRIQLVLVGHINRAVFATATAAQAPGVVHAGPVTDSELKALYLGAVALVFPSRIEGFGLPPLEAMSCGCPLIASNRAAIPEVCADAALYVDPDNVAQIASAMRAVVTDEGLRQTLRRKGLQRAKEFTWSDAARTLLEHLMSARVIAAAVKR